MSTVATRCVECGVTGARDLEPGPAGRFSAFVESVPWRCPGCIERLEHEEAERERAEGDRERAERARVARLRRQATSQVPRPLRRELCELELTDGNTDAISAAKAWVHGELAGLLLIGPVGAGKTTIAGAAVWERELRQAILWSTASGLLNQTLGAFDDERRGEALRMLSAPAGLALDDLDKAKASDWAGAQLLDAIDSRVVNDRPLLVTMNLSLDALATKFGRDYGEAIASRLSSSTWRMAVVDGPDRRTRS